MNWKQYSNSAQRMRKKESTFIVYVNKCIEQVKKVLIYFKCKVGRKKRRQKRAMNKTTLQSEANIECQKPWAQHFVCCVRTLWRSKDEKRRMCQFKDWCKWIDPCCLLLCTCVLSIVPVSFCEQKPRNGERVERSKVKKDENLWSSTYYHCRYSTKHSIFFCFEIVNNRPI